MSSVGAFLCSGVVTGRLAQAGLPALLFGPIVGPGAINNGLDSRGDDRPGDLAFAHPAGMYR